MDIQWISWIYETTSRIFAVPKPWGSQDRKRIFFDKWKFQMRNKEWRKSQHGICEKSEAWRRLSWNFCWMWSDFPITTRANWCHVWYRRYHRGSTCFSGARKTLQQHSWNDCYDWSIVFSWFSWSSHLWWAFVYSMHAAGILLGTIQVRTHVHLTFARQQSLIRAQRRLRLTMQHVYGHSGTLGNECADHAAALGTFGLISYHNVAFIRT